jgi:hypothetical protein
MGVFGIEAGEEDRVVIAKPGVAVESRESSVVKSEAGSMGMGSFVIVVSSGRASGVRIHESIKLDDWRSRTHLGKSSTNRPNQRQSQQAHRLSKVQRGQRARLSQ